MISYKQFVETAAMVKTSQDMEDFLENGDYTLLLSCRIDLDYNIAEGKATEEELKVITEIDARLKSIITPEQFEEMEWQMPEIKKWWG